MLLMVAVPEICCGSMLATRQWVDAMHVLGWNAYFNLLFADAEGEQDGFVCAHVPVDWPLSCD